MKKRLSLLVFLSFLVLPGFSHAQEKQADEVTPITMEEVVVTATRYEEKIATVPANVTVITEKDIKNSTAHNIPDLLRTQVGLQVYDITGNGRNFNVDIRGFGETAGLNTLVLVDGRRINQADLSGTDWTVVALERVKRIEIVRGGRGSVLYGDNAAGGVINIITKEGDKFHAGGELLAGSFDTFKASASVSGSLDNLSYALSGSYLDSDGYRDNSDTEAKNIGMNLNYYLGDLMRFNLKAGYHKDDTGLPGALKKSDFAAGASRTDSLSPEDFADVEDYYVQGGPELFFLNDSLFKVDLSFRKRDSLTFATFSGGNFTGDTQIETVAVSPQIVLKEKILGFNNSLTLGLDFVDTEEDIINTSLFFGFLTQGTFKLEKVNYGYYFHDEFSLMDNLTLSGGYRHDRAEFKFQPSTPERTKLDENLFTAGINYNFYKKSYAYFSFSRSFRYPVLDEIFSFFTNTINKDLGPQTSDDYEFGIRHYFTDSFYTNINLFRLDTKEEILYNPTSFANENLDGKTRRDGVNISLIKEFERMTLSGSYTYTAATIRGGQFKGKDVPNVPRHKATLDTLFNLGRGFTIAVNGVYIGERPFISDFSNDFSNQDDYAILNTRLKYNWRHLTIFLNVNNITNEEYSEYGVLGGFPVAEEAFFPSPKINFLLGISYRFSAISS